MTVPAETAEDPPADGNDKPPEGERAEPGDPGEQQEILEAGEGANDTADPGPLSATSQSTGKRLRRSVGLGMRSNAYRVMLGKGAIPPVSESWSFVARLKEKNEVQFRVMEGDEEQADRNELLGEVGLDGIKLREDGMAALRIEFTLLEKGTLEVSLTDQEGGTGGVARFPLPQFGRSAIGEVDYDGLPVAELSEKIDLLEQQMQMLKGELAVRRERE